MQEWLRCACERAAEEAEGRAPPSSSGGGGLTAGDWAAMREEAFPPSADNAYRHLRLHDFSDTVQRLPQEEVHGMGGGERGGRGK